MGKEKILVVEDEEAIQELIRYNLNKDGYDRVRCCESGEEALAAATEFAPDLILLDLMLPGMDGLAVCRRLKSDTRTSAIPIIMLTAKSEESDIVIGLEMGADDYLPKPFSPKVLIARIKSVLRRGRHPGGTAGRTADDADLLRIRNALSAGAPPRLGLYARPDRQ